MDLICESTVKVGLVGSSYFIGFAIGVLLFQMPSTCGRKKTFNILMPIYIIASATVIHVPNLYIKAVGYMIMGLLHLKITLSYTYIFELVPEANKGTCSSIINLIDGMTMAIFGLSFLYLTRDAVLFLKFVNYIESTAVIIFLIVAPESPSWYILNQQFEKGI